MSESQSMYRQRNFYKQKESNQIGLIFRNLTNSSCKECHGTCINLNSNLIFRPQNNSYFEYMINDRTRKNSCKLGSLLK